MNTSLSLWKEESKWKRRREESTWCTGDRLWRSIPPLRSLMSTEKVQYPVLSVHKPIPGNCSLRRLSKEAVLTELFEKKVFKCCRPSVVKRSFFAKSSAHVVSSRRTELSHEVGSSRNVAKRLFFPSLNQGQSL